MAAQNLNGCYSKRLLEAARYLWLEGMRYMTQEKWDDAVAVLRRGAAMKDGWGWGVNNGDIWMAQGAAMIVQAMDM